MLDKTAKGIIAHLQENGSVTNAAVARRLGVSEETVRRRIHNMRKDGIFQIVAVPSPSALGLNVEATIGIEPVPAIVDNIVEALEGLPEVTQVIYTTGSFSLLVSVVVKDNVALANLVKNEIGNIGGVLKMETFLILAIHKRVYSLPI